MIHHPDAYTAQDALRDVRDEADTDGGMWTGVFCARCEGEAEPCEDCKVRVYRTARSLFDNRLGWVDGHNAYAPLLFWIELGTALYGADDVRVAELQMYADRNERI